MGMALGGTIGFPWYWLNVDEQWLHYITFTPEETKLDGLNRFWLFFSSGLAKQHRTKPSKKDIWKPFRSHAEEYTTSAILCQDKTISRSNGRPLGSKACAISDGTSRWAISAPATFPIATAAWTAKSKTWTKVGGRTPRALGWGLPGFGGGAVLERRWSLRGTCSQVSSGRDDKTASFFTLHSHPSSIVIPKACSVNPDCPCYGTKKHHSPTIGSMFGIFVPTFPIQKIRYPPKKDQLHVSLALLSCNSPTWFWITLPMLFIQLQAPDRIYKVGPEPIVINGMTSDPYKWPQTGSPGTLGAPRSGITGPAIGHNWPQTSTRPRNPNSWSRQPLHLKGPEKTSESSFDIWSQTHDQRCTFP